MSPAAPRCIAQPGLADTTTGAPRVSQPRRGGWPAPCALGSHRRGPVAARRTHRRHRSTGRRRRCRAGGTRGSSTVRTKPCACCTWRRWHGSCTTSTASVSRSGERRLRGEPFREVLHTGRERDGLGGAEQAAVVLHRRAATRAVDDDGSVAGHRADHAARESPRLGDPPGVRVERATAVGAGSGEHGARTGGAHDGERGAVHVALPRVHHAPGEQHGVAVARRRAAARAAIAADRRGSPKRRGTRCSR